MDNEVSAYLCGGTFFNQILLNRKGKNVKIISQKEILEKLVGIFHLGQFSFGEGNTGKTYTSKFKSCQDSISQYTGFNDNNYRLVFDNDVHNVDSTALKMTIEFIRECIAPDKYLQLVKSLLELVECDNTIENDTVFWITIDGKSVQKSDIKNTNSFCIESFVLGIWHYIIMNRADDNKNGRETYEKWYSQGLKYKQKNYNGTVGQHITRDINVFSVQENSFTHDEKNDNINQVDVGKLKMEKFEALKQDEVLLNDFKKDFQKIRKICDLSITDLKTNYFKLFVTEYNPFYLKWCKAHNNFHDDFYREKTSELIDVLRELMDRIKILHDHFREQDHESYSIEISEIQYFQKKVKKIYGKISSDAYFQY